jgi:transposase
MRNMPSRIPEAKRLQIIADWKSGKSAIKVLARRYRVDPRSVSGILFRYDETGKVDDLDRPGRPRKTTPKQDKELVHIVRRHPDEPSHRTSARLRDRTGVNLDASTVRRRLVAEGLPARPFTSKPALSVKQKAARLAFAKRNRRRAWLNVLFSDETKVLLGSRKHLVRRYQGEKLYKRTFKHPGGVNVWGSFGSRGFGDIHIFRENMTGPIYKDILEQHLLPSAQRAVPANWVFQDDNDPKHRSKVVKQWVRNHNIKTLAWPSNSPDANPIENVWAPLKDRVAAREPATLDQLERYIREEWAKLTPDFAARLVQSMPRRMEALIAAAGDSIDY